MPHFSLTMKSSKLLCAFLFLFPFARADLPKDPIFGRTEALHKVASGEKCKKLLAQVDQCAAQVFYYFNPNLTIYMDKKSMEIDFCRTSKINLDCVSTYRECLNSPFQVSILNMLIHEMKEANKRFCASDLTREKFVEAFLCFRGENESILKLLARRVVRVMAYIANLNEYEEIIDAFCCAGHVLDQEDHMFASAYCGGYSIINYSAISICRSVFPIASVCSKFPDIYTCEQSNFNVTSEIRYITLQGIIHGFNGTEYLELTGDGGDEDETNIYQSPFVYLLQMLLKLQE